MWCHRKDSVKLFKPQWTSPVYKKPAFCYCDTAAVTPHEANLEGTSFWVSFGRWGPELSQSCPCCNTAAITLFVNSPWQVGARTVPNLSRMGAVQLAPHPISLPMTFNRFQDAWAQACIKPCIKPCHPHRAERWFWWSTVLAVMLGSRDENTEHT